MSPRHHYETCGSRQNTPAIKGAFYRPNETLYQLQPKFSSTIDGTGADGPRSEGGRKILLDNSRVYVRFLPFVSGRVHPVRIIAYLSILDDPLELPETEFRDPRLFKNRAQT